MCCSYAAKHRFVLHEKTLLCFNNKIFLNVGIYDCVKRVAPIFLHNKRQWHSQTTKTFLLCGKNWWGFFLVFDSTKWYFSSFCMPVAIGAFLSLEPLQTILCSTTVYSSKNLHIILLCEVVFVNLWHYKAVMRRKHTMSSFAMVWIHLSNSKKIQITLFGFLGVKPTLNVTMHYAKNIVRDWSTFLFWPTCKVYQ